MGVIIPVLAGILGAVSGLGVGSLLGGDKQSSESKQYAPVITYPYAQYSPTSVKTYQPTISYQSSSLYSPTINIESPYGAGATQTTKQDVTQTPKTEVSTITTPSISGASQTSQQTQAGTDWMTWLLLAGVGLAGVYLITRKR